MTYAKYLNKYKTQDARAHKVCVGVCGCARVCALVRFLIRTNEEGVLWICVERFATQINYHCRLPEPMADGDTHNILRMCNVASGVRNTKYSPYV